MTKKLLCAVLTVLLVLACAGCGSETVPAPTEQETLAFEPTTVPTATEAPTETPTVPASAQHSGLREDGSFSEGTLFIGDSLTYYYIGYLLENGLLGDAKFTAQCGSQVTAFFDANILRDSADIPCRFSPEFKGMEFDEAAASLGENAHAIYIMWGTNYTHDTTAQTYIDIVDYLLENCPNATVHLQLIPYGTPDIVYYDTVNERIRAAYDHYQQQGQERVFLIDTFTAIGENVTDGVHLNPDGNANWYQAIVDSAESNGLSL